MKFTKADREEAIDRLRKMVAPGDTIYTTLKHVSRSGMSRLIGVHAIQDNSPIWLSWLTAKALTSVGWNDDKEALRVSGCGMDMGYHVVYNLSATLYPDGFGCIGEDCPSNDHSNGDRDYTPHGHRGPNFIPGEKATLAHWHKDGGYALRHRWI